MDEKMIRHCELLTQNRKLMKEAFCWDYDRLHCFCAICYTAREKKVDTQGIKFCQKGIGNADCLCEIPGREAYFSIAALLSLHENPEKFLMKFEQALKELTNVGFPTTLYLAMAAFIVAESMSSVDFIKAACQADDMYVRLKQEPVFLTIKNNYISAIILSLTGKKSADIMEELRNGYHSLRKEIRSPAARWNILHILPFGELALDQKCERTMEIYTHMYKKGWHFPMGYEAASLGVLALTNQNVEMLVDGVMETEKRLICLDPFWTKIGKRFRMMYSAMAYSHYAILKEADMIGDKNAPQIKRMWQAAQSAMLLSTTAGILDNES